MATTILGHTGFSVSADNRGVRAAVILILCAAALTACGAATTPRRQPATTVERTAVKAPLTPICSFYSTLIAVGLTMMKPDKAKLIVPLLREHWPKLVAAAKRGQDVHWEPALEPRM